MKRLLLFLTCVLTLFGVTRAATETIDLTSKGYSNASNVTTVTQGDITLDFGKGSNNSNTPKWYDSGTSVRMYANNTLKISVPANYKLNSISFTLGGTKSATLTPSSGTGNIGENNTSWTAPSTSTNNVLFTAASSGQMYVQKITVNYVGGNATTPPASPVISCTNNTVTITAETGANIYYTTDGTEPTTSSTEYSNPFPITSTVTVKAIASNANGTSTVATEECTYTGGDTQTGDYIITTLNTTNFKGSGNSYAKYTYKADDITYTSVFAMTSGTMQFNTGNSNGKASAIVVTNTNPSYIIEKIDVTLGTIGNGVKVYSRNQAFGDLTLGTTPTIPSDAIQIEAALKANKQNIPINAPAFAIYPGGSGVVQVSSVTVYLKSTGDNTKTDVTLKFTDIDKNLKVGDTYTNTLTVNPSVASSAVSFSSSDESVATVNANGQVTALKEGSATITATISNNSTYNDASASYNVTVTSNSQGGETPTPGEGDYYTIIFDDSTSDSSNDITSQTLLGYITEGKDYIKNASDISKVYKGTTGLKFGTGSVKGNITLNLTEPVNATKIVVRAKAYNSSNATLKVNDQSNIISGTSLVDYTYELTGEPIESITLASTNSSEYRCYVKALTIYYQNPEPELSLGELKGRYGEGVEIIDQEEITVDLGTIFTFTAENAESMTLTITTDEDYEEISLNGEDGSFSWTVDKSYELAIVEVEAKLGDDSKELSFLLTVNNPTPEKPVVKIGEEELKDSKNVAKGTVITITSENAASIIVKKNGEQIEEITESPFTFTVNDSGEYTFTGKNGEVEGEPFSIRFTIGEVDPNIPVEGSIFKQVLNVNMDTDLVEGAYYVIGRNAQNITNPVAVAMSKNLESGHFNSTSDVEFETYVQNFYDEKNTKIDNRKFDLLTTKSKDVLILKLEKQNGNWALKTVNYGDGLDISQGYLSGDDTSNNLSVVANFTPAYISNNTNNNIDIKFVENGNYNISQSTGKDGYFNYQKGGASIQLYKYTLANKYEFPVTEVGVKAGATYTFEIPDPKPELTYKKKQNVACFEVNDNVITANNIQSADSGNVMVWWEDSEDWFGNLVEVPVNVSYHAELGFRHGTDPENPVRGKKDVGVVWQAAYYTGDGTLTYSVDSKDIYISPTTGQIRPIDIQNAKTDGTIYKVTAHVEGESNSYVNDDAHYYIVIEKPDENSFIEGGVAQFDFTTKGYGMYDGFNSSNTSGSSIYEHNVNEENGIDHTPVDTFNEGSISIKMGDDKNGNKAWYRWLNKKELRAYSGTFIVSCSNGNVTAVKFNFNKGNSKMLNYNGSEGELVYTNSNRTATWSSTSKEGVESVLLSVDGAIQIDNIEVTVNQKDNQGEEVNLVFAEADRVINMFSGEETDLPLLAHNELLTWDYYANENGLSLDIDEIDEWDEDETFQNYEINATGFNDIRVKVNEPGVYTFRAQYKGEDFLDGMAILRLNVFPRLSVLPTETTNDGTLSTDERTENPALTLVEPAQDNDGTHFANIVLPTVAEHNDDFKYSTVKVEVVVNQGENETTYKFDEEKPESVKFTEDGSITYTIKYGDTYEISETVYIVLMPKTTVDRSEDNKITLTPSKNATLKYAYVYGNVKKDIKRRATDIPNEEWEEADGNHVIDDVEGLKNEGVTAIFYKTEKDLSSNQDMVDNKAVPANPILADEGTIVLAAVPVELNIGTIDKQPFKTDTHTYTLSGIINFNNSNLEVGKDFSVTVTPKDDAEGWTSTSATGNELNAAYQEEFANIQGEEDGLYKQYTNLKTEYVDGFYTGVTNLKVTEGTEENSFTVSADLPCSGVYVVTVAPVSGSEFTFDQASNELTVYPNLQGTFGTDKGFNIEGYTFGGSSDNGGYYTISFPNDYNDFGKNMLCYIPGTYFANGLTASTTEDVTPETSDENDVYFTTVDLDSMNSSAQQTVYVTVSKNGASHQYMFVVNTTGTPNESTDVDSIDAEDGEVEYFTIDGIKVQNPENGIFIVRKGNKTFKVIK